MTYTDTSVAAYGLYPLRAGDMTLDTKVEFNHVGGLTELNLVTGCWGLKSAVIEWCETVLGYEPFLERHKRCNNADGKRLAYYYSLCFRDATDAHLFHLRYYGHFLRDLHIE